MHLDTFIDVDQFTSEVNENLDDITLAMKTQTARAAYYGIMHSKAKRQVNSVDLLIKAMNAKLSAKYRRQLTDAAAEDGNLNNVKPERVTAEMVTTAVMLDPAMLKYGQVYIEAQEIENVCRVAMDAFRTRSSMIVSLGNLTRDQLKTDVRIMGAKEAVAEYDSRRRDRDNRARPPS